MCIMNEFCKIAGYKVSIQKSVVIFLYINNELSARESERHFKLHQNDKIARNKLKEVKDLFMF